MIGSGNNEGIAMRQSFEEVRHRSDVLFRHAAFRRAVLE
jgi:hypothetical protein